MYVGYPVRTVRYRVLLAFCLLPLGLATGCHGRGSAAGDAGPALAWALGARGRGRGEIGELVLVDYADALGAAPPTWVAAPLETLAARA